MCRPSRLAFTGASCIVLSAAQVVVGGQSLGDAARKAAEQRQSTQAPSRAYTTSDLRDDVGQRFDGRPASRFNNGAHPPAGVNGGPPSREDIVRAVMPAVVTIETSSSVGSGFFVDAGVVLTNRHVVEAGGVLTIRFASGETTTGSVSATASDADLALVRVDRPAPAQPVLALGDASSARVGGEVLAIGSPLGILRSTVTRGIVSAVRTIGGLTYVQTDAAINPGNSGGPLLDERGYVIGITTAKFKTAESLSLAIAIEHAVRLIDGRGPSVVNESRESARDRDLSAAVGRSSGGPDGDDVRANGAQQLEAAVGALAREADRLDVYWERSRADCGADPRARATSRPWFGLLADRSAIDREAGRCRSWLSDIADYAARIDGVMQRLGEVARQTGVYPGVARDIRRKHKLDWSGWDR
jgi:S1-C subfamily serine protease